MRKVIYHLEPVLPKVKEKFPTINWGGCGVFANLLATELDKLGVKYKIIWIGDDSKHKKDIKRIFKDKGNDVCLLDFNNEFIWVSHIMIKIGRKFIDASGIYENFKTTEWNHREVICEITKKELELISLSNHGWNCSFNRTQIPKVERELKKIFKKVAI